MAVENNRVVKRKKKLPFVFHVQSKATTLKGRNKPSVIHKKFEAIKELGSGGFGRVYEVRRIDGGGSGGNGGSHKTNNDDHEISYACKIFDRNYYREKAEESLKQCFMAEMEINRKLKHPNIVEFKYLLRDDNYYYMFMEMVPGKSVEKIIHTQKPLQDHVVRNTFKQMVEAVYYIHRNNVVHLDIKPENFVSMDETLSHIKLCDFGLAREIGGSSKFKMHNGIVGTANFMAPEVLLSNGDPRSYTKAVDVWALGCCLYSLLFGVSPFEAPPHNKTKDIYELIKRGKYSFPSHISIDHNAKRIIEKCLEMKPENRPTCADILLSPYLMSIAATTRTSMVSSTTSNTSCSIHTEMETPSSKRRRLETPLIQ